MYLVVLLLRFLGWYSGLFDFWRFTCLVIVRDFLLFLAALVSLVGFVNLFVDLATFVGCFNVCCLLVYFSGLLV